MVHNLNRCMQTKTEALATSSGEIPPFGSRFVAVCGANGNFVLL